MSRPYYSEYVRHCLRFYCRNNQATSFRSPVDECNWRICKKVLNDLSPTDREIIVAIHRERDTLADNVYAVSERYCIGQTVIWDLLKDVEYSIAKMRGLV